MELTTLLTILLLTAIAGFSTAIILILKNNKELEKENWRLVEENNDLKEKNRVLETRFRSYNRMIESQVNDTIQQNFQRIKKDVGDFVDKAVINIPED